MADRLTDMLLLFMTVDCNVDFAVSTILDMDGGMIKPALTSFLRRFLPALDGVGIDEYGAAESFLLDVKISCCVARDMPDCTVFLLQF